VLIAQRTGTDAAGVLVEFDSVLEQEGEYYSGLWLSVARRFYAFEVILPRGQPWSAVVERWDDVTEATETSIGVPGRGKSIGALGLEVLGVGDVA
jgi:hypothetical protein